MRALTIASSLSLPIGAASGCPGGTGGPRQPDTGVRTIEAKGRVVDFESCTTNTGCKGTSGLPVALFSSRSTTGQFGQFLLTGKTSCTAEHTIVGSALKHTLAPVRVSPGVGFVAVGVHRATLGGSDAAVSLPDAAAPKEGGP